MHTDYQEPQGSDDQEPEIRTIGNRIPIELLVFKTVFSPLTVLTKNPSDSC
jgi:hypothetical protein